MEEKETISERTKKKSGVSRREFIAGTVGGVVVGAVAGAAAGSLGFPTIPASVSQPWLPAKWDYTADIVVIGYGGAGAVIAITAYDLGASVIILEKTPGGLSLDPTIQGGGGSTQMAGGVIIVPPDANSVSTVATHQYACSFGTTPMDVSTAWANVAVNIPSWLNKMGIAFTDHGVSDNFPGLAGGNTEHQLAVTAGSIGSGGYAFWKGLDSQVAKRKIPVLFNTPATRMIQNSQTREILGVTAVSYPAPNLTSTSTTVWQPPTSGGTTINLRANKAVALCTGGYEFDETMKRNNLRIYPVHFISWPYATGDGVRMAEAAGAGLWHMNAECGGTCAWFANGITSAWSAGSPTNNYIVVNKYGQRYCNDPLRASLQHSFVETLGIFNILVPEYSTIPTFLVFDETMRKAGNIGDTSHGVACLPYALGGTGTTFAWSKDNSAEVARGWIQQGSDIPSLAAAINATTYYGYIDPTSRKPVPISVKMDPSVLTATVNKYNSYCTAGSDPDFGRDPSTLKPIQTAPFYAMPVLPGTWTTNGGPLRNANAQVCDPWGNPIPRLYSAGELGSMWGFLYPTGGGMLTDLISFGQIAGQNAVKETPWT